MVYEKLLIINRIVLQIQKYLCQLQDYSFRNTTLVEILKKFIREVLKPKTLRNFSIHFELEVTNFDTCYRLIFAFRSSWTDKRKT